MTRTLKTLATLVIGLGVSGAAQAGGHGSHPSPKPSYHGNSPTPSHHNYHDGKGHYTPDAKHYSHPHVDHPKPGPAGTYRDYRAYRTYSASYYTNYAAKYAVKASYGYYYKGSEHRHWAASYYSTTYRTTVYYDVATKAYYYYHAPHQNFYPISHIEKVPPPTDLGPLCDE